jgi:hypothetical protein
MFLHVSRVLTAVLALGVTDELNGNPDKKLWRSEKLLYDTKRIEVRISKDLVKIFALIKIFYNFKL